MIPTLEWWELALRLIGAAAFGGLIGFEREYNEQPAGFRTHILVTVGAALFTIAGAYGVAGFAEADVVRFDPTRVAAQVVTGIGFLGAGAILRYGINIRGLTTAASIWVTASIGVAVALGNWIAAALTTFIALASLFLLRPIGRTLRRTLRRSILQIFVELAPHGVVSEVTAEFEKMNIHVRRVRVIGEEGRERQLIINLDLTEDVDLDEMGRRLRDVKGVTSVDWSR